MTVCVAEISERATTALQAANDDEAKARLAGVNDHGFASKTNLPAGYGELDHRRLEYGFAHDPRSQCL